MTTKNEGIHYEYGKEEKKFSDNQKHMMQPDFKLQSGTAAVHTSILIEVTNLNDKGLLTNSAILLKRKRFLILEFLGKLSS